MLLKRCSRGDKCVHPNGPMLPATPDYFHRDSKYKDGLHCSCKACYLSRKVQGRGKKRFLAGESTRFLKGGKLRCHAVSKRKLKKLREIKPDITADEAFPEVQCGCAALPGWFVCKHHLKSPGRKVSEQVKDVYRYLKGSLADKFRIAVNDAELFDQRRNLALLTARNAELFEDITSAGLSASDRLHQLQKVLKLLDDGQVIKGRDLLESVLNSLKDDKGSWEEIRKNMSSIKDLSNADMSRRKEMRESITAAQAIALMDRYTNALLAAVDKHVEDPVILDGIYKEVIYAARDAGGTPTISLLGEGAGEDREG